MKSFLSRKPLKSKPYFKGWYFKHNLGNLIVAFIPGYSVDIFGKAKAFIQIITDQKSFNINFPFEDFYCRESELYIRIGRNVFCRDGISVDIDTSELTCKGTIGYGAFTELRYNIMGPFALFKNMECNHGIVSLYHKLRGRIEIEGQDLCFNGGIGYIESDWGSSFPKSYTWLQCNSFQSKTVALCKEKICVFVSIAQIPFYGFTFSGFIAVVYYKNREYRFATYNGGKVLKNKHNYLVIRCGNSHCLKIKIAGGCDFPLMAPNMGAMERIIRERPSCFARFEFFEGSKKIFDIYSESASFEHVI